MRKRNVSAIETGVGLFQGFSTNLMNRVRETSVPFEAIYRLATPAGSRTIEKIVTLAHEEWLATQPPIQADAPLPPNHYRVPVTYAGMPPMEVLQQEWGKGNVSVIFDGRPFKLHASCQGMDRTPGERIFYLHDAEKDWESEERIAWGLKQRNAVAPNGYRPATHEEEYEFSKAHPELVDFVGLGSCARDDGLDCVAGVWQDGSQRVLGRTWIGGRWLRRIRALFVCK